MHVTRSLVGCEDHQPISSNQQIIASILLNELHDCLPMVKSSSRENSREEFRVFVQQYDTKNAERETWIDLADHMGKCACVCVIVWVSAHVFV